MIACKKTPIATLGLPLSDQVLMKNINFLANLHYLRCPDKS